MHDLDQHDGTPCERCGALLHRVTGQPDRQFLRPFNEPLALATYECGGDERHRWAYDVTRFDSEAGAGEYKLVAEEHARVGVVRAR